MKTHEILRLLETSLPLPESKLYFASGVVRVEASGGRVIGERELQLLGSVEACLLDILRDILEKQVERRKKRLADLNKAVQDESEAQLLGIQELHRIGTLLDELTSSTPAKAARSPQESPETISDESA